MVGLRSCPAPTQLFGDWRDNIHELLENGALDDFDIDGAPILEAEAGECYLFHSWLLRVSGPNPLDKRCVWLNIRYIAPDHHVEPIYHYVRAG